MGFRAPPPPMDLGLEKDLPDEEEESKTNKIREEKDDMLAAGCDYVALVSKR